jgi:hypothetical protein
LGWSAHIPSARTAVTSTIQNVRRPGVVAKTNDYQAKPGYGRGKVMKKVIIPMLLMAYMGMGNHVVYAREKEIKIYNRNYEYEMKVEGNRVLDKNYKTKYHLEGNKIYDENYRYQGKIEGNKIYDNNYRYQGKIEGDKVYDKDYRLKYHLKK